MKEVTKGSVDREVGSIRDPPKSVKHHGLVTAENSYDPRLPGKGREQCFWKPKNWLQEGL